jgi:hypothetical protein
MNPVDAFEAGVVGHIVTQPDQIRAIVVSRAGEMFPCYQAILMHQTSVILDGMATNGSS